MNFVIRRDYTKTQEMTKLSDVTPEKKKEPKPAGAKKTGTKSKA